MYPVSMSLESAIRLPLAMVAGLPYSALLAGGRMAERFRRREQVRG
jgi:hypothetical protein